MEVSVLMSVRDGEAFLQEAVDSIMAQTYRDFELVVVDNGSQDGTAAILAGIGDPRLRVLRQDPSLSLSEALNLGLRQCRGRWVARMDADDLCLPDRLSHQLAYLRAHPQVKLLGTSYECFGEEIRRRWVVWPPQHPLEVAWRYTWESCHGHPTVMFCRETILAQGGYPELTAQDFALFSRLSLRCRCANLGQPLLKYRWHRHNMSVVEGGVFPAEVREVVVGNLEALGIPRAVGEDYLSWHERQPVPVARWLPILRANLRVLSALVDRLGYRYDPRVWLWHLPRFALLLLNRVRQHLTR